MSKIFSKQLFVPKILNLKDFRQSRQFEHGTWLEGIMYYASTLVIFDDGIQGLNQNSN